MQKGLSHTAITVAHCLPLSHKRLFLTASRPMASASPAAPGLTVASAHAEGLANLRSDFAFECALPPPIQGVHGNDVATVWMLPVASDEEDALVAGESVTMIVIVIVRSEPACIVQVAPC